jgi:hypothetical protein
VFSFGAVLVMGAAHPEAICNGAPPNHVGYGAVPSPFFVGMEPPVRLAGS